MKGVSQPEFRLVDNDDGTYTVTFQCTTSGRYDISITMGGLHIYASPFNVDVKKAVLQRR